jgi:hypothetical protein
VLQDSNHYSPGAVVGVREALSTLKKAIMSSPAGEGSGSAALADRNAVANSPKYPNFFHLGSRVKKISYPGSGSASKDVSTLIQKMFLSSQKYDPGCSSWIRILIFYPSRIPDPGSKRHRIPDPQNWAEF